MLNVALPKGRLGDKVYDLLAGIGYGCPEDYNATRKLVVENPAAGIRYFLVKPSDVAICVEHGAGEVCLNSIDTDGVRNGFDLEMLDAVAARVNVPIIASGGAGKKEDFLELFHHKGIDAGLAAGIFHQKLLTIRELKEYLNENGVEMRL